ncbi:DUF4347 domain-containing protein [Acaryochloris marina]|nr:DUF4347 domain-containing protein [Acaryochloris marina]
MLSAQSLLQNSPPTGDRPLTASTLVMVDAAVQNYPYLLASPLLGMEVCVLNAQTDGIAQMKSLLSQSQAWTNLYLICHSTPGRLKVGSTCLSEDNLWAYADQFRQWRSYLTQTTEMIIYSSKL